MVYIKKVIKIWGKRGFMWNVIIDSIIDTIKVFPILFLAYVLIEFIEVKTSKTLEHSRLLKGGFAPLIGAGVGLVPQCGFSVIATDLYTKKRISIGTLLAMYIATSDEAVPILLSYPDQYKNLAIILAVKFGLALIVGYGATLFFKYIYRPTPEFIGYKNHNNSNTSKVEVFDKKVDHAYFVGEVNFEAESHIGCCGHDIEEGTNKKGIWHFIYHPIMHCIKILVFILIVNLAFGTIIHFVGEDTITRLLNSAKFAQPFIAGLIGLIPNCASSVVITNLFAMGGLSLGACISGLVANAGMGLALLVKQNNNKKHTIYIITTLYLISVIAGLVITLI